MQGLPPSVAWNHRIATGIGIISFLNVVDLAMFIAKSTLRSIWQGVFFYSFHYAPDNWRASQVRNIGAVEGKPTLMPISLTVRYCCK